MRHSEEREERNTAKNVFALFKEGSNAKSSYKMICYHCNKDGHFVRDCPMLGGKGVSVIGAKFGTSEGFREGDDPAKRPKHYSNATKRKLQERVSGQNNRGRMAGLKSKKGNRNTYAKKLKNGFATTPSDTAYNMQVSSNLHETLCSIEGSFPKSTQSTYSSILEETKGEVFANFDVRNTEDVESEDED